MRGKLSASGRTSVSIGRKWPAELGISPSYLYPTEVIDGPLAERFEVDVKAWVSSKTHLLEIARNSSAARL